MKTHSDSSKTKYFVTKIVKGILTKDEDITPDDIDVKVNILETYDIDSLTYISKIMLLEEFFDIDIPDGQAEELITVELLADYIIKNTDEATLNKLNSENSVNSALLEIGPNDSTSIKQIRHILTSSLFSDIQSKFKLHINSVFVLLSKLLRNNKIEHVSAMPKVDDNGNLVMVSILFLTSKQIYYIGLKNMCINFEEVSLKDLSIASTYRFDGYGNINDIKTLVDIGEVDKQGIPIKREYDIIQPYIDDTIKLISKINGFKGELYETK